MPVFIAFGETQPLSFGAYISSALSLGYAHVDGILDEIGFWKRVLTPDERVALYNSGEGLAFPLNAVVVPEDLPLKAHG